MFAAGVGRWLVKQFCPKRRPRKFSRPAGDNPNPTTVFVPVRQDISSDVALDIALFFRRARDVRFSSQQLRA
jgi:hypothetical protein